LKIKGLIWLDEIIDKLDRKHHVNQREVFEILTSRPHFRSLRKVTGRVRMSTLHWDRPKMEDISLYFLSTRKTNALLFCQPEI
jgi:hypothetical protein